MKKKFLSITIVLSILLSFTQISVMADDAITVKFSGGQPLEFDVPPQIINERTMVPLRAIFEALGASVNWDEATRTITSEKDGTSIKMTVDSSIMYVNGNEVTLDSPACVVDGRTLVPVRAISEAYNTNVDWNGDTRTVTITSSDAGEVAPISYEDISANVNQIKGFINDGLYLEAMQECENAKTYHTISDADIAIIDDLYNSARTKYNEYNDERIKQKEQELLEKFIQTAVNKHIASFKNPSSAKIYSIYAGYYERSDYNEDDSGEALAAIIDSSGQNSFGGTTRDETTIIFDMTTKQMIMDLESYGEQIKRDSYGKGSMHGMELATEALYLQMNKQKIFQSYDVSKYVN